MRWRKIDFENGTYGLEQRKPGGWKIVQQNQDTLQFTKQSERDQALKEILIGDRLYKNDSTNR